MTEPRDIVHGKRELKLKDATRGLVEASGGTDGAAASLSTGERRVRQQRMSDCQLRNTDQFLRIDEVAKLEAVAIHTAEWPPVTRAMAELHGFDLIERPRALPSDADWCWAMGAAVKEFGDAQQAIIAALPNGVTAREIRDGNIRREIGQALRHLAQLDALCLRALDDDSS